MAPFSVTPQIARVRFAYHAAAFFITFGVYILTLCPTVYVGDSGEFITNAVTLGINHPTGYPLYTLASRLAVLFLPWWKAAYAVNIFSAVCASLAVVVLSFICMVFTTRRILALSCSLLFGFSYTLWSRSTTAEVYTLNALMVALAVLFLLRWYFASEESSRTRYLVILAYLVGFGLSQHVTGALVAVSVGFVVLLKQPRWLLNAKLLLGLVAVALVGFSIYLYLPVRSFADPPVDWGNPETLDHLAGHFFPKTVAALFGESSDSGLADRVEWLLRQAFSKEFWFFGALFFVGIIALSYEWRLVVFFVSVIGINSYFTILRKLPFHADFDAYFIPTYLVMAILLCIGIEWMWNAMQRRWEERTGRVVNIFFTAITLTLPAVLLTHHYKENDRSANWFAYDFGMNLLERVPRNALLFTVGDEQTFIGWYFKYVEKMRQDVTILGRNMLGAVWGGSHMYNRELHLPINEKDPPERIAQQVIALMIDKRPIVFTPQLPWDFLSREYNSWHSGMTIHLLPKGSPMPPYQPTSFAFHPDWTKTFFDERCKLIVKFYYKEFIDNAKFWYSQGNREATRTELESYLAFPYPKEPEDNGAAFLLLAQLSIDRQEFTQAEEMLDSAALYIPANWRYHELKGNVSYLRGDTAGAVQSWRTSLTYNPNNPTLRRNIEILSKPPVVQQPPRRLPPQNNSTRRIR